MLLRISLGMCRIWQRQETELSLKVGNGNSCTASIVGSQEGGRERELLRADTYSARLGWDFGNLFVALTDSQVAKEKQLEKLYAYFAH